MADHPLKPAMDRRLGRPLPHQLPNPTRADPPPINLSPKGRMRYYSPFPVAIPQKRVRSHALLTRPPLTRRFARLACVRPAASVRSEPGSNSQVEKHRCLSLTFEPLHIFNALPLRYLSADKSTHNHSTAWSTRLRKRPH